MGATLELYRFPANTKNVCAHLTPLIQLSEMHQKAQDVEPGETAEETFHCQLCDYSAPCTEAVFFTHLCSTHLKVNQCPLFFI